MSCSCCAYDADGNVVHSLDNAWAASLFDASSKGPPGTSHLQQTARGSVQWYHVEASEASNKNGCAVDANQNKIDESQSGGGVCGWFESNV